MECYYLNLDSLCTVGYRVQKKNRKTKQIIHLNCKKQCLRFCASDQLEFE